MFLHPRSGSALQVTGVHALDRDQLHIEWLGGLVPGIRAQPGQKISICGKPNRTELRDPTDRLIALSYSCSETESRCRVALPTGSTKFDP